jgi:proteasome lid subunit RPN8/RPN11
MSTEMQTKVQASPVQNFTPAQTGLLQKKSALCNTPGLVEDSGRDVTLQRSPIDQAERFIVPSIMHEMLCLPRQPLDTKTRSFMEPRFGYDFSRVSVHSTGLGTIQTKLKINDPGDPYEQEADRVAEQMMATPKHAGVSGASPRIQRYAGQTTKGTVPPSVDRVLASSGRPLEPMLQQDMEQRFGHDFSRVRVHSGATAEQSARDVSAHAYTVGHNVVFGAGQFVPGSHEGRRLLVHELTHVVQQSNTYGNSAGQSSEKRGLSPIAQNHVGRSSAPIQRQPAGAKDKTTKELSSKEKDARSFVDGVVWLLAFSAWLYRSGQLLQHPERFPNSLHEDLAVMRRWFLIARGRVTNELNDDADLQKNLIKNYRNHVYTTIVAFQAKEKTPAWKLYEANKDVIDSLAGPPPSSKAAPTKPHAMSTMDNQVMPNLKVARCGIINTGLEFCGNIIARPDGSFRITGPVSGRHNECGQKVRQETPGETLAGYYHSHPRDPNAMPPDTDRNLDLSEFDKNNADELKIIYYLVNWKNEVLKYYPKTNPDAVHGVINLLHKFENLDCD